MHVSDAGLTILFYAFAALAVGAALLVAATRNIVRAAFGLLAVLFAVGGLYATAGADFLAGIQLLIYVGGILVLLIFAVMLTHRISNVNLSNESAPGPLALLVVTCLLFALVTTAVGVHWPELRSGPPEDPTIGRPPGPQTHDLGLLLAGRYLLPFEAVSVLLLAALVGAAYLARKEIKSK